MNKIILIGNVGKDAELTYTPSGSAVAKFSLAVSRRWTDKTSGEKKDETMWFNISAWNQLAEICGQYVRKGTKVYVEGRLSTREYTDREGKLRTSMDVTISEMELLTARGEGGSSGASAGNGVNQEEMPGPGGQDFPF